MGEIINKVICVCVIILIMLALAYEMTRGKK